MENNIKYMTIFSAVVFEENAEMVNLSWRAPLIYNFDTFDQAYNCATYKSDVENFNYKIISVEKTCATPEFIIKKFEEEKTKGTFLIGAYKVCLMSGFGQPSTAFVSIFKIVA